MNKIDNVFGDAIERNDIVEVDGEHHEVLEYLGDVDGMMQFLTHNLDTGDKDPVLLDPDTRYDLFDRSF